MNLCLTQHNSSENNFFRVKIKLKQNEDCKRVLHDNFSTKFLDQHKVHFHFTRFTELLIYLKKLFGNFSYQEKSNIDEIINLFSSFIKSSMVEQLQQHASVTEQRRSLYGKLFRNSNIFEDLCTKYLDYKIYSEIFTSHNNHRDEGFRILCKMLEFIKFSDFYQKRNQDLIETNLCSVINQFRLLHQSGSWSKKIQRIRNSFQHIVKILELINGSYPGSEETQPILIYSIIKAQPFNFLSSFNFMKILMEGRNLKGEIGFMLTQVEIAIRYIEIINQNNLEFEGFDSRLLLNEVKNGLHSMKEREKYGSYEVGQLTEENDIFIN